MTKHEERAEIERLKVEVEKLKDTIFDVYDHLAESVKSSPTTWTKAPAEIVELSNTVRTRLAEAEREIAKAGKERDLYT